MKQIAQLKYYMSFSMYEISTMTAEEREFFLDWFVETKRKENEAKDTGDTPSSDPKFGPAAT